MATPKQPAGQKASVRDLPRNLWAVSLTSFFMDISSEMVINVLPLFLVSIFGVSTSVIGLIEGVAEATASILKLFPVDLSDRAGERKWLAVAGVGAWLGLGPSAPFIFGGVLALIAAGLMAAWKPPAMTS